MRIAPGLWLRPSSSSAAFTPVSLFTGQAGALYDTSDMSTMFSDIAGTTPAVAGGPVGKILDKSGNGNHAVAPVNASRPILNAGGYLTFDGVDDVLKALFTVTAPADRITALRPLTWSANKNIYSDPANTSAAMMLQQAGVTPDIYINSGLNAAHVSPTLNTDIVLTERFNGASSSIQLNNAAAQTGSAGTNVPTGILIGARSADATAGFNCVNFRWFGTLMSCGTLTAGQIAAAKTYFGAKAGLSI
jgi:hypothetical protein